MAETLVFSIELPVYPERVYRAWLDTYEHGVFTGKKAQINARVGGTFEAVAGQVKGEIKVMTPHDRIVQTWHMAGFPSNGDAEVELLLEPTCTGTELKFRHSGIPDGKSRETLQWWESTYLRPLLDYFEKLVGEYPADMGDG
jgi:activator of HSP90 ATPase